MIVFSWRHLLEDGSRASFVKNRNFHFAFPATRQYTPNRRQWSRYLLAIT